MPSANKLAQLKIDLSYYAMCVTLCEARERKGLDEAHQLRKHRANLKRVTELIS